MCGIHTHAHTHTHIRDLQSYIKILIFIISKLLYVLVVQEIKMKLSQVSSYHSQFIYFSRQNQIYQNDDEVYLTYNND